MPPEISKSRSPAPAVPKARRVRPVPAVTRSIAILRLLGESPPMGVKSIAEQLGLVPSTCLHIVRVLVDEQLLKVDEASKRYSLGIGMLSLARSVVKNSTFSSLAQPMLDELSNEWGVTTMGVETAGAEHMAVVALSRAQAPFGLHVDVGSRFPALVSATGRLVAAFGQESWPQLQKRFKSVRWDKPIEFAAWKKEVELARRNGYSIDRGNYINGVTIVAVPVLDEGQRMSHSLVAAGLSDQLNGPTGTAIAKAMLEVADSLSTMLPYKR
jgi:DNA-binding IclR family transcriptional regulator